MENLVISPAFLAAQPSFQSLDHIVLSELAQRLELINLDAGEFLFAPGDARDSIFFIISGNIQLLSQSPHGQPLPPQVLGDGQALGEISLVAEEPYTSTARALDHVRVLRLSRFVFEELTGKYPEAMDVLSKAAMPAASKALLAGLVSEVFGEVDATDWSTLLAKIECLHLKNGNVLLRQGEDDDRIFVVIYGRLRIVDCDSGGTRETVDEVGRGETISQRTLQNGGVHSVHVYALSDSAVGIITRPLYESLKFQYPDLMARLNRAALHRVQVYAARREGTSVAAAEAPRTSHAANVGVLAVGVSRGAVPLSAFTARLVSAMPAVWNILHLSSARVDDLLGKPGISQAGSQDPSEPVLAAWLKQQEQSHFCVIYEADDAWTPWTERCLRMSDRVLLVGLGAAAPVPTELDELLARLGDSTRAMLVLLQPDNISQPSGTAAWLDHFAVSRHNHLRLNQAADFDSFIRRILGRGLGLVLGGGGARGFAHIGVFRALAECGVEIDLAGGTSMGAILSGTFAMGLDYQENMKLARDLASPLKIFDPTVPVVSFFSSSKVTRVLEHIFGDIQIEDLWMPYFCVSSNLTHAVAMIHRRGPLWQAVRASMAIPGIFSPVLSGGDILVDGCVLDNLPIDVMQRLNYYGPIIAVNVFPDVDMLRDYDFGPSISGWRALANKLNPLASRQSPPLLFESLVRVLALNSIQQAKTERGFADVYIRPPVEKFNILDFGAYAQIAEVGYRSAMEALESWEGLQTRSISPTVLSGPTSRSSLSTTLLNTLADLEELLDRQAAANGNGEIIEDQTVRNQ